MKELDSNKPYLQGLTYKQKLFVEYYQGNATEAAVKAGYSKKTAYSQGQRLLKNVEIVKAIKKRDSRDEQRKTEILTAHQIRKRWSEIIDDLNMTPSVKLKALDSLARSQGLFLDRVEMSGQIEHLSDRQLEQRIIAAIRGIGKDGMMELIQRAFSPEPEIMVLAQSQYLELEEGEGKDSIG